MDYHSDAFFGLARAEDLAVLQGKRTTNWSPQSAINEEGNDKHRQWNKHAKKIVMLCYYNSISHILCHCQL